VLKIEQPARLNKYVDQTIPITWKTRWSAMKLSLPLMLFCSFLFIEMAALRWFLGKPVRFDVAAVAAFTFPLLPLIAAEIQLRVAHQTKRVLKIDDTGVSTSIRGSSVKWRWPTVQAFEICPIAEEPTLRKVVIYSSRNSPKGSLQLQRAAKAAPWAKRHFKDANELTRAMRTVALALGITCTTAAVLIWRTGTKLPPQESVIQSTVAKI
jgi:hypothetical protein